MGAVSRSSRNAGFSLLEMLVVVALIALLGGVAAISLGGDFGRVARKEAEALQQALQMAADEAVYQGTEMGAYVTEGGYGFLRYDADARSWQPYSDRALKARRLPERMSLQLLLSGKPLPFAAKEKPALVFYSSGEMTAFRILLSHDSGERAYALGSDGLSPVMLQEGAP